MKDHAKRRREQYHRARRKLIAKLGGKCKCCNTKVNLEFHHLKQRTWEPHKTSRWVRLARYKREAEAGLVELRCRHCNAVAGKPVCPPPID